MKKKIFVAITCMSLCASTYVAQATPRGYSTEGIDYTLKPDSLNNWSFGIYTMNAEQRVTITDSRIYAAPGAPRSPFQADMLYDRTMLYVGYDLPSFFTIYAGLGQNTAEWKTYKSYEFAANSDSSGKYAYNLGLLFNIFNHDFHEPMLLEDELLINGSCEIFFSKAEMFGQTLDWQQMNASLTASLVNDISGNKKFLPERMAIFLGPIFSTFQTGGLKEEQSFGFTAGLDLQYNPSMSFDFGVQKFDLDMGYRLGFNVRF